jgi:hypothetical protein
MVQLTTLFATLVLFSPAAFSHPLSRRQLSADTLLQNGQEAQSLNAEFDTLQVTDPCNNGDIACIQGALAQCINGQWETQSCPTSLQCFALPDVDQQGVTVGCTDQATAQGLITATGAQGGVSTPADANSTTIDDPGVQTVTVTVTLPQSPDQTQTLSPSTTTLTPDDANGILSSVSVAAPTTTSTDGSGAVDPVVANAVNTGSGTTIILSGTSATPAAADIGSPATPVVAAAATTILLNNPAVQATPTPSTPAGTY